MTNSKRRRGTFGVLDQIDTDDVERLSSDSHAGSRKRPRASVDGSLESLSPEESEDGNFLQHATQFAAQHKAQSFTHNRSADNGIIEAITCSNFMCHSHLEIELGPLINFITGHNGSGKSAILTALTICLGGKASSTNRGQNLKSFIKEGEESATLSVRIKNQGESAYQQETYGTTIVVERHFSRSGNSAFKIKSGIGRLISTKRGDLEEICDYFALQIDNPMNILTQDMARQFLNSASPQEKYKFFMKGTQLEHLDSDYLVIEQILEVIDTEMYKKQQDFEILLEQARKADEIFQLAHQQDGIQERLELLRRQIAWVQVQGEEDKLEEHNQTLQRLDEDIACLEGKANGLSEAFGQMDHQFENAKRSIHEAREAMVPLEQRQSALKEHFEKLRADQSSLQTDQRAISNELKAAKLRAKKVQADIDQEKTRLIELDGGKNDERRKEIEDKLSVVARLKQSLEEHDQQLPSLHANRKAAVDKVALVQSRVAAKKDDIQEAESRLAILRRDRGQQLTAYPANMSRLQSEIERRGVFRAKPVGPVGNHVRLLKPDWSSILEKQFGTTLDSFIVTCKEDQTKLAAIMQSSGCVCPILISSKNRLNTDDHEPHADFVTWLRVLEIDNDLARNSLIINQSVDQTILIDDRDEALSRMKGDRIHNVRQCFTTNTKLGEGIRYGYGFGGSLSESFIPAFRGMPRMKTDTEYQISVQIRTIQDLKRDLVLEEQQLREAQSHIGNSANAIEAHNKERREKLIEYQGAQNFVEELQDALDQDQVEEGRLDALKSHLAEANEEITTHEGSYEEACEAKETLSQNLRSARESLQTAETEIDSAKANLSKAELKASHRGDERMSILREKNTALANVTSAKGKKEETCSEQKEQEERVLDFRRQAEEVSRRVAVERAETEESLSRKYDKLGKDLERIQRRTGDRQEISQRAMKAKDISNRARQEIKATEALRILLETTLANRRERWKIFQKSITSRARIQFFYLLSERGFRGFLKANHKQKLLDLTVEPDETRRGNGRSTQGLSGGEKSFSQICLLLSIWEAMGAPTRALDEFDVFMDSVNRSISMELMVKFARNSPGKQFVLISPGEGDQQLKDPDVKIVVMPAPERGQQTLRFAAQA